MAMAAATNVATFGTLLFDVFGSLAAEEYVDVRRMRAVKKAERQFEAGAKNAALRMLLRARSEFRLRAIP